MLTASCPNCASPIRFAHADSLSTVCPSCDSVLQRQDRDVTLIGRVSAMPRELTPVQVGATGTYEGVEFRVLGGMRKERDRVRWNEWYVHFDDGTKGWLSESNGQHFLFLPSPQNATVDLGRLAVGGQVEIHGHTFQVSEKAHYRVAAATGELPFRLDPERNYSFADLRQVQGPHLATIDGADVPPSVWVGVLVHLHELKMEGLRPFAGWSDPVLVNFAGPQIESVQAQTCPSCSASITVRAPGVTAKLACEYCGTELSVDESAAGLSLGIAGTPENRAYQPTLPLGTKGELDGIPWEIIGAMQRYVRFEGEMFFWTEYLLFNPYRGTRWLIEDASGHWNVADPVKGWPELRGNRIQHDGRTYRHFQRGRATVGAVAGEFTWEVHKGDEAATNDFIAPPHGLSHERTQSEETWTETRYLPHTEVEKAFGVRLVVPGGVYLNQPNPYSHLGLKVGVHTALLFFACVGLMVASLALSANQVLFSDSELVALSGTQQVWVSEPFEVPDTSRNRTEITLSVPYDQYTAGAGVSLVNTEDGRAWTPRLDYGSKQWTGRTSALPAGSYLARVELAFASEQRALGGGPLQLTVVRDTPWPLPALLLMFASFLLPVGWLFLRGNFETRRWSQSDYA